MDQDHWNLNSENVGSDVAHEIGHFLGNTEEYGQVSNVRVENKKVPAGGPQGGNFGAPRDANGGIMNANPKGVANAGNFWHVMNSLHGIGLKDCTLKPFSEKCN